MQPWTGRGSVLRGRQGWSGSLLMALSGPPNHSARASAIDPKRTSSTGRCCVSKSKAEPPESIVPAIPLKADLSCRDSFLASGVVRRRTLVQLLARPISSKQAHSALDNIPCFSSSPSHSIRPRPGLSPWLLPLRSMKHLTDMSRDYAATILRGVSAASVSIRSGTSTLLGPFCCRRYCS